MLARSEQSGISEPEVGNAHSHSDGLQSAGPQSVTHQSLLDVSQAILQHRDLAGLFRDLAARLRAIVPFDFLNLVLYDAATNTMRLHILESSSGVEPARARDGVSARRFALRLGVRPPTTAGHPGRQPGIPLAQNHGRAETQPRGQLLLAASHHRSASPGRADVRLRFAGGPLESQLDFMRQVSAQVAVAVDNTLNFEKAEKYQRQLARERDRLQVLLEITNALVSELDIRELFPSITACLRRVMPSEYSSLALLDERRRQPKESRAGVRRQSGHHPAGSHGGAR